MSPLMKFVAIVLAAAPLAVLAQDKGSHHNKMSCISGIVYSKAFLERFPRAGAACREVKIKDGHKWVRFNAKVTNVKGRQVTADFLDKYEHPVQTVTFEAAKEADLIVDGKVTRYTQLTHGDNLEVWMPENRVGLYAEPGVEKNEKLKLVKSETPPRG